MPNTVKIDWESFFQVAANFVQECETILGHHSMGLEPQFGYSAFLAQLDELRCLIRPRRKKIDSLPYPRLTLRYLTQLDLILYLFSTSAKNYQECLSPDHTWRDFFRKNLRDVQEFHRFIEKLKPLHGPKNESPATTTGKPRHDELAAVKPIELLTNWREIFAAIGLKYSTEKQRSLKRYNDQYDGPIPKPVRGSQPICNKAELIQWWNQLDKRATELGGRKSNAEATVKQKFTHGRSGTVVPGINGSEKKTKRSKR